VLVSSVSQRPNMEMELTAGLACWRGARDSHSF